MTSIPKVKSYPIVGNNYAFFTKTHQFFSDAVAKHGPVFNCSLLGEKQTVITDSEVVQKLLLQEHRLIESSWPKATLACFGSKGPGALQEEEHASIRRVIAKAFTPELMKSYFSSVLEQCTKEMNKWASNDQIPNLFVHCQRLAFNIGMRVLFGELDDFDEKKKTELFQTYLKLNEALVCLPIYLPGSTYYNAYKARKKLDKILLPILQEFRDTGSPKPQNLMEVLTNCPDPTTGEILPFDVLLDVAINMLFASHDTTACAMTYICLLLNNRPDVVETLKKEQQDFVTSNGEEYTHGDLPSMPYLNAFVTEQQYQLMVFATIFRHAKQDFQIPGYDYTVKKGQKIILETRFAQLGAETYIKTVKDIVESFDLEDRYERMYGSKKDEPKQPFFFFGGGKRICPGRSLANIDLRVFTIELIRNFDLKVESKTFPDFSFVPLAHPKGKVPFSVTKIN